MHFFEKLDIKLRLSGCHFWAHRDILSSRSSFFEGLFRFNEMSCQEEGYIDVHLPFCDRNIIEGAVYEIYLTKYDYTGIVYPVYMCLRYLGVDTTEFVDRELQKLDVFEVLRVERFSYKDKVATNILDAKNLIKNIFVEELGFPSDIEIPIEVLGIRGNFQYIIYGAGKIRWPYTYPYTNRLLVELAKELITTL